MSHVLGTHRGGSDFRGGVKGISFLTSGYDFQNPLPLSCSGSLLRRTPYVAKAKFRLVCHETLIRVLLRRCLVDVVNGYSLPSKVGGGPHLISRTS